ncbi:MAG: hypothetical protein IMZ57_11855 [Acidobacteria bacterium]|nr:hypothetical protein [Acidobacteriota bacterium]
MKNKKEMKEKVGAVAAVETPAEATVEAPERNIIGSAEVWTEGLGNFVYIKRFRGCVLEVDLSRFMFKSAQEAGEFITKLYDQSGYDSMILANLSPVKREDRGHD